MPETKTDTPPTSKIETVEQTLRQWAIDKAELNRENAELKEKLVKVEKELDGLREVVKSDIKADAVVRITQRSNFTHAELEPLSVPQLLEIEATLAKTKGGDAIYKNIRAGNAGTSDSRMTVGSLYGKTREQILAMGGEF